MNFLVITSDIHSILHTLGLLLTIFLYAEIHYHFPIFHGRLYRKQPEILFDAPYRIQTDSLPILLLIKDAHWFPVTLKEVQINIKYPQTREVLLQSIFPENCTISDQWFNRIYSFNMADFRGQYVEIECIAIVKIGKRNIVVKNDNYPNLSHKNLVTYIDSEPLPCEYGWVWGDMHCHSAWTEDQVEFGIPAEVISTMAKPMGLSFSALTDHSYDLDDLADSWNKIDPELRKWKNSRQQIDTLNKKTDGFCLIPGEEVSVDNGLGQNIHMVILNYSKFIPGDGDGFENILSKASEHHYSHILDDLPETALAFAAHPKTQPPFIQRILIKRGIWNKWDSHHPHLSGYQIINGIIGQDFYKSKKFWIQHLLKGSRAYIYAGNDSHGNFNRFRQVKFPQLKMHEHSYQIFGEFLTCIKLTDTLGVKTLIDDLKSGAVIVSNGPYVSLTIRDKHNKPAHIGEILSSVPIEATIAAQSSKFFGNLRAIKLILGNIKQQQEIMYHNLTSISGCLRKTFSITLADLPETGYFRVEISTHKEKIALTNPIWFNKEK